MADREKLFDLMMRDPCPYPVHCSASCKYYKSQHCHAERYADHIIADGWTKQEWIPVTERLPEVGDYYLVVVKCKYDWEKEYDIDTDVARFYPYDNPDAYIDNRWDTYNDWDEGQQYIHITHWMPLPQPPKGG